MSDGVRERIMRAAQMVATQGRPIAPPYVDLFAEEDAHGVVTVRSESGALIMMMHRHEWDTMRKELGLEPLEPTHVQSVSKE